MRALPLLLLLLCGCAHAQPLAAPSCFSFCLCAASPVQLPGSPLRRSFRKASVVLKAKVLRIVSKPPLVAAPPPPPGPPCIPCLPPVAPVRQGIRLPCCPPCPPRDGDFVYRVRVHRIFKGVVRRRKVLVSSPADLKARCGISLKVGAVYLLMAAAGRPLPVSQCLVSREWRTIAKLDRRFLRKCAGSNPVGECTRELLPF